MPDLPLAITRSAEVVGPFLLHNTIPNGYALGALYRHLGETLYALYSPKLRIQSIHIDDWCPAVWKMAHWVASRSRSEADELVGESLPPVRIEDQLQDSLREKVGRDCCPRSETPIAPIFNVVDDTQLNQSMILDWIGESFQIRTGYVPDFINALVQLDPSGFIQEMNGKHAVAIARIVEQTGIDNVAMKVSVDTDLLANRALALDNAKIKRILGWSPLIRMDRNRIDEIFDKLRELNQFPKL